MQSKIFLNTTQAIFTQKKQITSFGASGYLLRDAYEKSFSFLFYLKNLF